MKNSMLPTAAEMAEESRIKAKASERAGDDCAWAGDLMSAARHDSAARVYMAEAERYESLPFDTICPRF
jgi:hypothetical protein